MSQLQRHNSAWATLVVARAALLGSVWAFCCWVPWVAGAMPSGQGLPGAYLTVVHQRTGLFLIVSVAVGLLAFLFGLQMARRKPHQVHRRQPSKLVSVVGYAAFFVLPHVLLAAMLLSLSHTLAAAEVMVLLAVDSWAFVAIGRAARSR